MTIFLLNFQKCLKKRKFFLKKLFPSNCVYGYKESSFDNFAGKLSTTGRVFFSQCPENTKKRFNLKNASKSFYGHVASIFDHTVEKHKTKGWNFSTQKRHKKPLQMKDCYSEGSIEHLDCSFDKRAKKLLPEGGNFWSMSKKFGKKRERFCFFPHFVPVAS